MAAYTRIQKWLKSALIFTVFVNIYWCYGHEIVLDDDIFKASPSKNVVNVGIAKPRRFLLYDVNPGEGFNLRRDVYMRMSNLVKKLREKQEWILVLPPWGRIYHWKSPNLDQYRLPWSLFFNIESLNQHVPVIEFTDYLKEIGKPEIEEVYTLQRYAEGWTNGKFEEKYDERECIDRPAYNAKEGGRFKGWFWGYDDVYALNFKCLSVQGFASILAPMLWESTTARSVFLDRAEEILHDNYGGTEFWEARRSMRFAQHLIDIGNDFRKKHLKSTDEKDKTVMKENWQDQKPEKGTAKGGPYLAVHLRRQDFARNKRKEAPSIENAAQQINKIMKDRKLKTVFLATDAHKSEIDDLKNQVEGKVVQFKPSKTIHHQYKDGGVAIIDQWIAAHARYFIGTCVSTFSFRIQDERQILGFDPNTTYNCFCGDKDLDPKCEQPTKWDIMY
ncbi:GDP-fucose protein O-fucosyltransferase 2-like isoform X2 [Anneissia japonica]|uniref:GDP-fucose protein O-fucosyltransferase 2-like isoform X2 n=1 Tax=Anneissia japonica TaxID=1529436 RepID=UPI0014259CCD|nr:GDP-fucose protein O-fucosyltransferase 2-like isoform X2 [Anneissia japonica]